MCFLSDFSIDELLSQTLKVEALDQPVFFSKTLTTGWFSLHHLKKFIVKFQEKSPTTLRSSSSVLIGESQNPTDRRTSTAVDADAKQGENFTWPKRKIFSNNISGLLPFTQVRRLQITKNQSWFGSIITRIPVYNWGWQSWVMDILIIANLRIGY